MAKANRQSSEEWKDLLAAVANTKAAYDDVNKRDETKDDEQASNAALDAYDDAVEAVLAKPASNADEMRWKIARLAKIYGDDETWDAIDALLPRVLEEALNFIRD